MNQRTAVSLTAEHWWAIKNRARQARLLTELSSKLIFLQFPVSVDNLSFL